SNIRNVFAIPADETAKYFLCAYQPALDGWQVAIPVGEVQTEFTIHPLSLLSSASGADWPMVNFRRAFPELAETSEGYEDFELSQFKRVLKVQVEKDYEAFKLFDVQLSMKRLLTTGVPAILVLQLYLYLQLIGLNEAATIKSNGEE